MPELEKQNSVGARIRLWNNYQSSISELKNCRELLMKVLKEDFDYSDIQNQIKQIDKELTNNN